MYVEIQFILIVIFSLIEITFNCNFAIVLSIKSKCMKFSTICTKFSYVSRFADIIEIFSSKMMCSNFIERFRQNFWHSQRILILNSFRMFLRCFIDTLIIFYEWCVFKEHNKIKLILIKIKLKQLNSVISDRM